MFLGSTAAISGEGIVLGPTDAVNQLGTQHTVTATVQDSNGDPIVGTEVAFEITSGPNTGMTHNENTDSQGKAQFTYTSSLVGTDTIVASFVNGQDKTISSNQVTKEWVEGEPRNEIPEFTVIGGGIALLGAVGYALYRRRK